MYLNTSFRFRKNHLYKLKNYCASQDVLEYWAVTPLHVFLKSSKPKLLLNNTFSAFRRQLGRKTEKLFRFHVLRKPDTMVTAKPREIRMGKGKGAFSHVYLPVRAGSTLGYLGWCRRLCAPVVLGQLRKSVKKFGLSVRL